jgi:class 3 adenylate cyclase
VLRCSVCGHENRPGARFCDSCGAALSPEPTVREERKIVTILFADLVGFTQRAERMDPEDVRALLQPYWQRLRSELERFGGTVEKFIGTPSWRCSAHPLHTRTTRSGRFERLWRSGTGSVRSRTFRRESP